MFDFHRSTLGFIVSIFAANSWAGSSVLPVPEASSPVKKHEKVTVPTRAQQGQNTAQGFLSGGKLKLTTRNFYSRESSPDPKYRYKKDGGRAAIHARNTWVQGTMLQFSSGYSRGAVGFGVDISGYQAVNLERGKARVASGGNRTLVDSSGRGVDEWSKLGVADAKFRISNTELKLGRLMIDTPVINSYDNRALPSSFDGFGVISAEFDGLGLQMGSITRVSPRTGAGDERLTTEYGTRAVVGDRFSYFGGTYKANTLDFTFYGAKFEDVWNQYYLGIVQRTGDVEDVALKTAINGYRTNDSGSAKAGNINNTAVSASLTATHRAHSLTFSYQQVFGDEYFDYLHETAAIYLANAAFSDFNGPNEKSLRMRYETDWARFGIPGWTTAIYYIVGWDIDGTHYHPGGAGSYANYADVLSMDDEKHHEVGVVTTYVVQSGVLKNSRFNFRVTNHVASNQQVDGNVREVRMVSNFPFDFL